jgi:predicted small secreted protein
MKTKNILPLTLLAALCALFFSTGCNTMNGAGKDIEKAGDKIQDAAQRNK